MREEKREREREKRELGKVRLQGDRRLAHGMAWEI